MSEERDPRQLGFWMTLALVMGNVIGAGIFLLPASLAPFGQNATYGWLLTIGGCLCLACPCRAMATPARCGRSIRLSRARA